MGTAIVILGRTVVFGKRKLHIATGVVAIVSGPKADVNAFTNLDIVFVNVGRNTVKGFSALVQLLEETDFVHMVVQHRLIGATEDSEKNAKVAD